MKLIYNAKLARVEAKEGRKVLWSVGTGHLPEATVQGILDGADPEAADLQVALLAAVEAALARKGSVVPDEYRYRYGADQNCGDDVAKKLTAAVTHPETGVDVDKCAEIAAANGVGDRFDGWLAKDLNPGMLRMNLGNVLRGKARRGEEVVGL